MRGAALAKYAEVATLGLRIRAAAISAMKVATRSCGIGPADDLKKAEASIIITPITIVASMRAAAVGKDSTIATRIKISAEKAIHRLREKLLPW